MELRLANLLTTENRLSVFRIYKKLIDHADYTRREVRKTSEIFGPIRLLPTPIDLADALENLNRTNLLIQENFNTMVKVYECTKSFFWLDRLAQSNLLTSENFNAVAGNSKPDDLALIFCKLEKLNLLTLENKNIMITSEISLAKIKMSFILAGYLKNLDPKALSESWGPILQEAERLKNIALGSNSLWDLCEEINDTKLEKIARNAALPLLKEINLIKSPYFGNLFTYNLKRGKALNLALDILVHRNTSDQLFPQKNQGFKENFCKFNLFKYLGNADLNNIVNSCFLEDKNQEAVMLDDKKRSCTIA